MDNPFPTDRKQKRECLLNAVDSVLVVASSNSGRAEDLRATPRVMVSSAGVDFGTSFQPI